METTAILSNHGACTSFSCGKYIIRFRNLKNLYFGSEEFLKPIKYVRIQNERYVENCR